MHGEETFDDNATYSKDLNSKRSLGMTATGLYLFANGAFYIGTVCNPQKAAATISCKKVRERKE